MWICKYCGSKQFQKTVIGGKMNNIQYDEIGDIKEGYDNVIYDNIQCSKCSIISKNDDIKDIAYFVNDKKLEIVLEEERNEI